MFYCTNFIHWNVFSCVRPVNFKTAQFLCNLLCGYCHSDKVNFFRVRVFSVCTVFYTLQKNISFDTDFSLSLSLSLIIFYTLSEVANTPLVMWLIGRKSHIYVLMLNGRGPCWSCTLCSAATCGSTNCDQRCICKCTITAFQLLLHACEPTHFMSVALYCPECCRAAWSRLCCIPYSPQWDPFWVQYYILVKQQPWPSSVFGRLTSCGFEPWSCL